MAILNRHTDVPAERTVAELQARLVKARAQAVMMEYDPDGVLTHLSSRVEIRHGAIAFRLPANVEGVHRRLLADSRLTGKQRTREQAARVAWRICKTWVEAQLSRSDPSRRADPRRRVRGVIEAGTAALPEVFLPYAQTSTGETVYERFERQGLPVLTHDPARPLPPPGAAL